MSYHFHYQVKIKTEKVFSPTFLHKNKLEKMIILNLVVTTNETKMYRPNICLYQNELHKKL